MIQGQEEMIWREIPKGLLNWYPFRAGSSLLFVGEKNHPIRELLSEYGNVTCKSFSEITEEITYDYAVVGTMLERESAPANALRVVKNALKPEGVLLLALNNRLGVRNFCGDKDIYTGRNFDGIEEYQRVYDGKNETFWGRTYSRAEVTDIIRDAGWKNFKFYSVFSDLKSPALIFSEDFLPKEDLSNRIFPTYNFPDTIFLDERILYNSLVDNGMFHAMANGFLIECLQTGESCKVSRVTSSLDRGREDALQTIVYSDGNVCKRSVYPEGKKKLENLYKHGEQLKARGIRVVDTRMEDGNLIMPYMDCETGQVYLRRLLSSDKEKFLGELDRFVRIIRQSSDCVLSESGEEVFEKCYLDMIPLNSFFVDGEFVFFDQEFCEEKYPVNVLLWRVLGSLYAGNTGLNRFIPMNELTTRYGLENRLEHWQRMEQDFLNKLLKKKELKYYYEKCRSYPEVINSNRQRINFTESEYQRLFVDIFKGTEGKKLILFGSGMLSNKFLELYGQDYPVYKIVDNWQEKWGETLRGIEICSPDILKDAEEYKVIICIKNYFSVMKQLNALGVKNYSIYDSGKDYPRKRKQIAVSEEVGPKKGEKKKYHVGYVAGVFDLFHIGHLNMFKKAKEYCDYLIVGVVTDERCIKVKNKKPFIPFEERVEMVSSCRYVDEVVTIPENYGGTRDAWKLYHFDCQFSGSDYINSPEWLSEKEFLNKNGAELVFFPYTEQTSSTKIKSLIEKELL